MRTIKNKSFGGERPLFESHGLRLEEVTITEDELKAQMPLYDWIAGGMQ